MPPAKRSSTRARRGPTPVPGSRVGPADRRRSGARRGLRPGAARAVRRRLARQFRHARSRTCALRPRRLPEGGLTPRWSAMGPAAGSVRRCWHCAAGRTAEGRSAPATQAPPGRAGPASRRAGSGDLAGAGAGDGAALDHPVVDVPGSAGVTPPAGLALGVAGPVALAGGDPPDVGPVGPRRTLVLWVISMVAQVRAAAEAGAAEVGVRRAARAATVRAAAGMVRVVIMPGPTVGGGGGHAAPVVGQITPMCPVCTASACRHVSAGRGVMPGEYEEHQDVEEA